MENGDVFRSLKICKEYETNRDIMEDGESGGSS